MPSLLSSVLFTVFIATAAFGRVEATDDSLHKVQMVAVTNGVTLEVLDWGGTGRAIIFLPGGGDSAHVFDQLAPELTAEGHIYGITQRGFGA